MGPQNGIVGDDTNMTELPQTEVDNSQLKEMQKAAKFARSAEFKELKKHFQARIEFYDKYLPSGQAVGAQIADEKLAAMWVVANVIAGEFNSVINVYEQAIQYVKDAQTDGTPKQ